MTPSHDTLKLLTINIWNRQGPWLARAALLRAGLERLAPDVVGLQEVIHGGAISQLEELSAGLGYAHAFGQAIDKGDGSAYGNAVLSRLPIVQRRVLALPGAELDEPRSVLVVQVLARGGRLPVLVTHFAYRLEHGHVRERQAMALAAMLEAHAPVGEGFLPAVVMGDLNAGPETPEIRLLTAEGGSEGRSRGLIDCYAQTGEPPGYTFDGRHNAFAAPWQEPPRRIDYVLVRGPDARGCGTPLTAEVVLTEVVDGVTASDHWGVLATIRV